MTLSDLADVITTRTGLLDSEDLTAARKFLRQRHEMLYNEAIWKDSLREFDYSTSLNGLKLTVADNGASGHIDSASLTTFTNAAPSSTVFFKSLNDAYGIISLPIGASRVVAVRSTDRYLKVQSREWFYRADLDRFYAIGTPCDFTEFQPAITSTPFAQSSRFSLISDNVSDIGQAIVVKYLQSNGMVYTDSFLLLAAAVPIAHDIGNGEVFSTSPAGADTAVLEIYSIVKGVTQGNIYCGINGAQSYPSVILAKNDLNAPLRPRIKLINPPTQDITLRFLVKMKCPQFQNDTDEPAIRNMENCLIAFAMADLLEYDKQFSKAQAKQQEGVALLTQLKDIEAVQSANNQTIVPETGFGNSIYQPLGRGYGWTGFSY